MPNNIINEVIFDRPASEHPAILAACLNGDGEIDFELLIPTPINVWQGNVGSNHTAAFGSQNISLDWSRLNWGTKWNAHGHCPVEADEESLTLRFQTAWSPPYPWLVALFNTCGGFRHHWLDEGRERGVAGVFSFDPSPLRGNQWKEVDADEALQRHLHKLLWGVEEFEGEDA